jgi:formylmethanofuran dehydrogenase subunit C
MLYNTGTIAISGNTLTGTGTNFTAGSLIRNGCTVIALTSPRRFSRLPRLEAQPLLPLRQLLTLPYLLDLNTPFF